MFIYFIFLYTYYFIFSLLFYFFLFFVYFSLNFYYNLENSDGLSNRVRNDESEGETVDARDGSGNDTNDSTTDGVLLI